MSDESIELLTVSQVASFLQVSISEVYALCRDGRLLHFRIGTGRGTIRVCRQELLAFLNRCRSEGTKKPAAPMKEQQAKVVIRPFKHIQLIGVLASPPDEDDQAAGSSVSSDH